jgi:thiol-disulfide isomerase/thioredoxin
MIKCLVAFVFSVLVVHASGRDVQPAPLNEHVEAYRVEIITPGGPLPFVMYSQTDPGGIPRAGVEYRQYWVIQNGDEIIKIPFEEVVVEHFGEGQSDLHKWSEWKRVTRRVSFDHYDSSFEWSQWMVHSVPVDEHNKKYEGVWRKRRGDSVIEVPIVVTPLGLKATHGMHISMLHKSMLKLIDRFNPFPASWDPDLDESIRFTGRWSVQFEKADGGAVAVFEVDENQKAKGTFQTTTGDYRFLEGRVDGRFLRLATFDGAHAFLFHAEMVSRNHIRGDFWSGNWWHETWTAVRDDDAQLPDAFEQTSITDETALEELVFKDTEGNPTRVLDALNETKAKARILEIFGTWCPNCSDAGRELVSLKEKYGDDLGIVGLAFEVTEDFERSAEQVKRHHAYIGTDWEILIAGLSDKAKATQTLGFLDKVRSYPTLVFMDEHNQVRAIYSGFSGPATGDAYTQQRERFEELIESMLE